MKITYRNVDNAYEDLTKMLNNQLDILDDLDSAVNEFIALNDFTGTAADNIKAYFTDIHGEIIKTLKALVYYIDVTMYYSNQSFEQTIDTEYSPIYESSYIQDKIDTQIRLGNDFNTASSSLSSIVTSVSDICSIDETFCYQDICNTFTQSEDFAKTAKSDFEKFNETHLNDFTDTVDTLSTLTTLIGKMAELGNVEHIQSYVPGSINADECMGKLRDYQINVGEQIEKNGWDTNFEYLETYSQIRTVEGLIKNGYNIGVSLKELYDMYKAGVKFTLETKDTGEVIFKVISNFDNASDIQAALRHIGAGSLTFNKIRELSGEGLKVIDSAGNVVNKTALKRLLKSDAASDILKYAKGIKKYAGGESAILKFSKDFLDVLDVSITVGTDIYDNIYNPTTGKYMQDFGGKDLCDTVTDLSIDLGCDLGLEAAGGAIGTLFCPGIGTAIGAGIGALIDIGVTWEFGEPPESIADHIKDGIADITDSVGDWFSTVFW